NTAIYGTKFNGISFAIPSSIAKQVARGMRNESSTRSGYLGIGMQLVNSETVARLQFEINKPGVLVGIIRDGSPAEAAGLKVDDIVLRWNDQVVDSPDRLREFVAKTTIGSTAKVVIFRSGKTERIDVLVGSRPLQLQTQ
ncbi:S1C family serine protease, partial [Planctomycetota bacterium]